MRIAPPLAIPQALHSVRRAEFIFEQSMHGQLSGFRRLLPLLRPTSGWPVTTSKRLGRVPEAAFTGEDEIVSAGDRETDLSPAFSPSPLDTMANEG